MNTNLLDDDNTTGTLNLSDQSAEDSLIIQAAAHLAGVIVMSKLLGGDYCDAKLVHAKGATSSITVGPGLVEPEELRALQWGGRCAAENLADEAHRHIQRVGIPAHLESLPDDVPGSDEYTTLSHTPFDPPATPQFALENPGLALHFKQLLPTVQTLANCLCADRWNNGPGYASNRDIDGLTAYAPDDTDQGDTDDQ